MNICSAVQHYWVAAALSDAVLVFYKQGTYIGDQSRNVAMRPSATNEHACKRTYGGNAQLPLINRISIHERNYLGEIRSWPDQ